jgi:hypothetical protein
MSDKLPPSESFLDLSDYGRPLALWLTRLLLPTPVNSLHVTWAFWGVGLGAAALYAVGGRFNTVVAGLLLLVKSVLDAVDGSLARVQQRPSRVGRFMDSVFDFAVNLAVFLAIAIEAEWGWIGIALALVSLEIATLQGSWNNYGQVVYRHLKQGDTTSRVDEQNATPYPWDNPTALRILHWLYLRVYGWQDRIMAALDRWAVPDPACRELAQQDRLLLSLATPFGLGFQLLIIAVFGWMGRAEWALWWFIGPFNVYWIGLLLWRRLKYRRCDEDR